MNIYIEYGFAEGPKIAKKFIAALEQEGHTLANKQAADAIFAHSLGAHRLKKLKPHQLVIVIDPPLRPHWTIWSIPKKVFSGIIQLEHTLHNIWYTMTQPHKIWIGIYRFIKPRLPLHHDKTIFVHNEFDLFCSRETARAISQQHGWRLVELPGHNDDL